MKPMIKAVISPDIADISTYSPEPKDDFGFLLQLLVGPEGEEGMESFELTVCTPKWLSVTYSKDSAVFGRHHLILFRYNYKEMMEAIDLVIGKCTGKTWAEVANKIARFAKWEFEDYVP